MVTGVGWKIISMRDEQFNIVIIVFISIMAI